MDTRYIKKNARIVVGMSGGVDSSVAALLLKEKGYEVIGLFMNNWEEDKEDGSCHAEKDAHDAEVVCKHLKIPYYAVNFSQQYWDQVFKEFLREYQAGYTPNPDILCNREIKFKAFLKKSLSLGADYLATGHYAKILKTPSGLSLCKAQDQSKDQSYFLYTLGQKQLEKALFPLSTLSKSAVREIAKAHNLPTWEKKDSTGICFIGKRQFSPFLKKYLGESQGFFETLSGKKVGKHMGMCYYTIGQRKGIGLGGPGEPWYVVGKNPEKNIVYVEQGAQHPSLYAHTLTATQASWVLEPPKNYPFHCKAKIRYSHQEEDCSILKEEEGRLFIQFKNPQRAITPRQSIVFYKDEECLGGAMIEKAGKSLHQQKSEK